MNKPVIFLTSLSFLLFGCNGAGPVTSTSEGQSTADSFSSVSSSGEESFSAISSYETDAPKRTKIGDLWFKLREDGAYSVSSHYSRDSLPSRIVVPDRVHGRPVVELEDGAFKFNQNLTEIVLPETIERIGKEALTVVSLTSFTCPKALRILEDKALSDCQNLREVILNDSLEEIGENVFAGAPLTSLRLPKGLRRTNPHFFSWLAKGCTVTVDSDNPVMYLDGPFLYGDSGNTLLFCFGGRDESQSFPSSLSLNVHRIESYAFVACSRLSEIHFGEKTREIGEHAFDRCSSLQTVTFEEGLVSLNASSFMRTPARFALPYSVSEIIPSTNVFQVEDYHLPFAIPERHPHFRIEDGYLIRNKDNCLITPASAVNDAIRVPEGVAIIGENAFRFAGDPPRGIEIFLPSSLRSIEDYAFATFAYIDGIHLNEGLVSIGNYAFGNKVRSPKSSEATFLLPSTVESLGDYAFPTPLDDSVPSAPARVTYESFTLSKDLKEIGFNALPAAKNYVVPEENQAFSAHDGQILTKDGKEFVMASATTTSYIIPNTVETIRSAAFQRSSIREIVFPSSLREIGNYAFEARGLKSLDFRQTSLTRIGEGAFENCYHLAEVFFPTGLSVVERSAFYSCPIASLDLSGTSLINVESGAFFSYGRLAEVLLPSCLTHIGTQAFEGSFERLILPVSVSEIADFCFASCENLQELRYEGTAAQWENVTKGWWINSGSPFQRIQCSDSSVDVPSPEAA